MTWQRIDENTYIDDTLVTCAEYQLFIDETREQGKYYQPDHWTSYQFPNGQAREPIVGVRRSDALEFCKWLTSRDKIEWKYRLPTQNEADAFPVKSFGVVLLGYWNAVNFTWVGIIPSNPRKIDIHHFLDRDLELARHREIDIYTGTEHIALYLADALVHDLNLTRDHNFSPEYLRRIDRTVAQHFGFDFGDSPAGALNRTQILSRDSDIAIDLALARHSNFNLHFDLDRARNLALSRDHGFALDIDRVVDFAYWLSWTFDNPLNSSYPRGLAFDVYIDVLTLRERIAGRSPTFEGIRLVKERIK